jgi:hypothetical protein
MGLEGLLLCPYESAIISHPEPDESSPHPHTIFLSNPLLC